MNYQRINWQDRPSQDTPINAENLNVMDEGIATLSDEVNELADALDNIEADSQILEARLDVLAASGGTGSEGNVDNLELADIRSGYDGSQYATAGNAVRGQINSVLKKISEVEESNTLRDARIDALVATPSESTEGNSELVDIRIGYDGTEYDSAGAAVRSQINKIISSVGNINTNADNTKEVTQSEYDQLSESEQNDGTIYFVSDGASKVPRATAATTSYDDEKSRLDADSVQGALESLVSKLEDIKTKLESLNGIPISSNADLDDYTMPGTYYSTSADVSSTISNTPEALSAAFVLKVYPFTTSNSRVAQELFTASARYTRTKGSGTWGAWYKFDGTKLG